MSYPQVCRLLRAHQFIAKAFETVRVPDSLLAQAYAALKRAYP